MNLAGAVKLTFDDLTTVGNGKNDDAIDQKRFSKFFTKEKILNE